MRRRDILDVNITANPGDRDWKQGPHMQYDPEVLAVHHVKHHKGADEIDSGGGDVVGDDCGVDEKEDQDQDHNGLGSDLEENEDELAPFRPLLSNLRLSNLPLLALSLKTSLLLRTSPNSHNNISLLTPPPVTCTLNPTPLCGSYHILYLITFTDNTTWLFKFPGTGYSPTWTPAHARKLRSEAMTMKYIKKRTTKLPVPEVYGFDESVENIVGAPYIAMEFIKGVTMFLGLYGMDPAGKRLSQDVLERRREK